MKLSSSQSVHYVQCPVCHQKKPAVSILPGETIRSSVIASIQKMAPTWTPELNICLECLNKGRSYFVEDSLMQERGILSQSEKEVIDAIKNHELISLNSVESETKLSFGDKVSDTLASIGGSWRFIIIFCSILLIWIFINSISWMGKAFDPYPYILLNLLLSCLAALQAPIIMMSQNRQETKDRARAEADYKTNLKAELEIRHLHLKLDQLVNQQWYRLLEIQQIQLDMMNDLKERKP